MNESDKGGIAPVDPDATVEQDIDPELVDDRDFEDPGDDTPVELPEYDSAQFEDPDDEYDPEEDGDE